MLLPLVPIRLAHEKARASTLTPLATVAFFAIAPLRLQPLPSVCQITARCGLRQIRCKAPSVPPYVVAATCPESTLPHCTENPEGKRHRYAGRGWRRRFLVQGSLSHSLSARLIPSVARTRNRHLPRSAKTPWWCAPDRGTSGAPNKRKRHLAHRLSDSAPCPPHELDIHVF